MGTVVERPSPESRTIPVVTPEAQRERGELENSSHFQLREQNFNIKLPLFLQSVPRLWINWRNIYLNLCSLLISSTFDTKPGGGLKDKSSFYKNKNTFLLNQRRTQKCLFRINTKSFDTNYLLSVERIMRTDILPEAYRERTAAIETYMSEHLKVSNMICVIFSRLAFGFIGASVRNTAWSSEETWSSSSKVCLQIWKMVEMY